MTFEQYKKSFTLKAQNAGYSEENIQKCLGYAEPLINKDLPVIYNTSNLCSLVGYDKHYLKKAAFFTKSYYRDFTIKKKNGGVRNIREPLPSLKEIQIWILNNILYKIEVSKYAKAYVKNRTILENVKYHVNREFVLTLDLKDFFPSIKIERVKTIFLDLGYSSIVSDLLSKLCCLDGHLPQGAPTSPYISNIVMNPIDDSISKFCNLKKIRYTRYADDLSFSGSLDKAELISFVETEIEKEKFALNPNKTLVSKKGSRQIVTGILVNEKIQLPKNKRKQIRLEMHYIKKFGLYEHLKNTKNTKANYVKHLLGRINYGLFLNPKDEELKGYKNLLIEYLKN